MVNVYGDKKRGPPGPPGEPGPPGKKGVGLSSLFFSKQLARWFYENCDFSCYFKDERSGFVYDKDKPVGIKNQKKSSCTDALCTTSNAGSLVKIPDYGYGLQFKDSVYKIDEIEIAEAEPSEAILFFTFKIPKIFKTYQYILATTYGHCIYLKDDNLIIQGSENEDDDSETKVAVKYETDEWNKCYIEFNCIPGMLSIFQINDIQGTFKTEPGRSSLPSDFSLYIGGEKPSSPKYPFKGLLARIDIQLVEDDTEFSKKREKSEINLSPEIRKSVMDQFYCLTDN